VGPHPELLDTSAAELRERFERGELTSAELTRQYLERIDAVDRAGPTLRSVIETNPEAMEIAAERDRERREGHVRGPIHGMPVIVKDNIDTGDRMLTTAGSLALAAAPASRDADLVQRLRDAGAVLLAKANLSEWANFRSTRSCSGWSGRGRQCRNPHVLDRSPCGSSSGSAAAVAAGLCALAVGTETDGSIVCPSSVSGVVGIKPTVGVIAQQGIVPISHSQDSAGPHARTVADAAALLGVLATTGEDYARHAGPDGLRGARIGVLRDPFAGYHEQVDRAYEESLKALRDAGAELIDPVELDTAQEMRSGGFEIKILLHEFKHGLNAYLTRRPGLEVSSLAALIAWNDAHADQEMPYFRQELFEQAEATEGLESAEYLEAIAKSRELAREKGIDATIARHQLDALVAPSRTPAWTLDPINGDRAIGGSTQPSAMAGYPIITVPAGLAFDALPMGLSFFGAARTEGALIRLAAGFEHVTQARRAPRFLPTLNLP
jgi:amidase